MNIWCLGVTPEVLQATSRTMRIEILTEISNSYLLKDILAFDRIKNSGILLDLLKLLAFQVGQEVAINELATKLGVDVKTIKRYLDLLEKAFVIYRLTGFSRNLREEVTNKSKYYFFDNGIRNALIAQFSEIDQRNDHGALWENFLVIERLKLRTYLPLFANVYFWRTYQQQEIDLIEEHDGDLYGYEFKWSRNKKTKPPSRWKETYNNSKYQVINPDNYLEFLLQSAASKSS